MELAQPRCPCLFGHHGQPQIAARASIRLHQRQYGGAGCPGRLRDARRDAQNPPTEADSLAAQTVVDQYQAWVAYQNADPTDPDTQAALLAAFEALGGDPLNPPLEADALAAQTVVDQYNAWTTYLDAEAGAADAFLAASVSYKNANLDETALAELRALVDAIVATKDLAN